MSQAMGVLTQMTGRLCRLGVGVLATSAVAWSFTVPPANAAAISNAARSRLVWHDDFNGPAGTRPNLRRWKVVTGGGGWGNRELEYYSNNPGNVSLNGRGDLAIIARRQHRRGLHHAWQYTSARLYTRGQFRVRYGRLEARIRIPEGEGLWPAFWALGGNGSTVDWPECGEIDVMENLGQNPFTVYGSIHGPQRERADGYGYTTPYRSPVSLATGFHTYAVTLTPTSISYSVDGYRYAVYTRSTLDPGQSWVFNRSVYLLLNLAVGGTWPGNPTRLTKFPARMLVDWVRVYSGPFGGSDSRARPEASARRG